jgi:hypothetical protein
MTIWPAIKDSTVHAIDALEIRDVNPHISTVVDTRDALSLTFSYINTLDQTCSFQVEGSVEETFAEPQPVGAPRALADGSVTAQRDYDTLTDYWPFIRVVVTAGGVPTVGQADAWILKETGR